MVLADLKEIFRDAGIWPRCHRKVGFSMFLGRAAGLSSYIAHPVYGSMIWRMASWKLRLRTWTKKSMALPSRLRGGQRQAEVLGYIAEWERLVLDGKGRVDLVLTRGAVAIACEVSVTTTIEHEVQNVLKCVQAGFQRVAVVCMSRKRLKALEEAIQSCLDGKGVECDFHVPSDFLAKLQDLAEQCDKCKEGNGSTRRRVNLFSGDLSDNQRREREKQLLAELAQRMRRPRARP